MRHLKLFEGHNPYYSEIGYDEYRIMTDAVKFSKRDIEALMRLDPNRKIFDFGVEMDDVEMVSFYLNFTKKESNPAQYSLPWNYKWYNGQIFKYEDDWFTVRIRGGNMTTSPVDHIWKCDQIDGLVRLLQDVFEKRLKI